ncbi:MAG: PhoH family protein, partial [Burkholderiaceae bacterium]|nr:PhoH family protein [Burkholderiaceae bacterium]
MPLPKAPTKPATFLAAIPTEPAPIARVLDTPVPLKREAEPAQPQPVRSSAPTRLAVVESIPQAAKTASRKPRLAGPPKLFVLDTNVLLHDPTSLFRFEEHDVFLPMMTLEELDSHKKGMSEVARSARQVSRTLDSLVAASTTPIEEGIPLSALGNKDAAGRVSFQTHALSATLPDSLPVGKADNQILAVVRALKDLHTTRDVVLVSKDINMRVKARVLGLPAEDYTNDKVLEDTDLLYTGVQQLPASFWDKNGKGMESWQHGGFTYYRINGPI